MKVRFGFGKLKTADRKKIKLQAGYDVGSIPLVGLGLPCLFDRKLLRHDYVYGGTEDELKTLKIAPEALLKVNEIIGMLD
jgi:prolyl-tRNA editing enzyme YbaK/EbsC (Cys-tRNA(Pro) deacylase)